MAAPAKEPIFVAIRDLNSQIEQQQMVPISSIKRQISFEEWWAQISRSRKFTKATKEAIQTHMNARGFLKSGQFNAGLRDFGIKA